MARERGGNEASAPSAGRGVARRPFDLFGSVPLLRDPGASESLTTVLVAFGANVLIAVAKSVAAAVTGSASLVAEAAHSWADTGNEIFLLIANRRSRRPADAAHPLGHGREAYVWSLFAALGVFVAGAAVSVTHGIQELIHPEPASHFAVGYVVLGVSFVLAAHQVTGSVIPDAAGSILVGVLLAVVALALINRNRWFLVGQEADPRLRKAAIQALLDTPEVARVTYLRLEIVGPRMIFVTGDVDLTGDDTESRLAVRLRALEAKISASPAVAGAVLSLSAPDEPTLTA